MTFTADDTRTTVLSHGFEGYGWDERTGEVTYSYFVPNGKRRSKICKKLIVIGADDGLHITRLSGRRLRSRRGDRRCFLYRYPE